MIGDDERVKGVRAEDDGLAVDAIKTNSMRHLAEQHSACAQPESVEEIRALAHRFQSQLERERTRLAQVLHDDVSQKLTVVCLELALMDGSILSERELSRDRLHDKVRELVDIVNELIQSLRKIKAELRPKVLDEFGLVAAIESESKEFQRKTGISCHLRGKPLDVVLPHDTATELFRMVQEILANVAEHARARLVEIEVRQNRAGFFLQVRDDGKGISQEQVESPGSIGLLELRERALLIGGKLEMAGRPGSGTVVTIRLPKESSPPPVD